MFVLIMRLNIKITLIIFGLLSTFAVTAQDRKIDKLEMLYDQGNYKMVIRRSERLMSSEAYEKHPSPKVFHALAEYQLIGNKKFSSANAVYDYEKFLQLDSLFYYQNVYQNYISDMELGISEEIRILNEKGEKELAKIKYATYIRLFDNVAPFEELVISEVVIKEDPKELPNPDTDTSTTEDNTENKPNTDTNKDPRSGIVTEAHKHIGTPYVYGGVTKKGFDCSGYTSYVFKKNGYTLPRTATTQSTKYPKVKKKKAMPGDLVFFGKSKSKISHVGIIVSKTGEPLVMIHASSSRGIMVSSIEDNSYWSPRFLFITRVIQE